MLDKNDKDGTIEFLKERIRKIRDEVNYNMSSQYRDEVIDSVIDLCDKTLLEVTF